MFELYGLVIYEVLNNGNLLSGVYTNNDRVRITDNTEFDIESEIAIRSETRDCIGGEYSARYIITGNNEVFNRRLLVASSNSAVFRFTWLSENNTIEFEVMGIMVGQNHIAVSYVEPRNQ